MAIDLNGIVTWLKGWFYDKSEVNTYLNAKANKNLTNANMNVVTDSSGDITTEAKPVIPDVSGFIDTAGRCLNKSGTTINHDTYISSTNIALFRKIKYDQSGHITGTANVSATDLPTHTHIASEVSDDNAHSNIGIDAHSSQSAINTAIDTAIGNLQSIKAVEVVSALDDPVTEANMGKLYIISENSKINVYYAVRSGTSPNYSYSWHKMDADILDELSIDWSDVQNKPSTFTPSSHTHGNLQNDGTIGNSANKVIITGSGGSLTAVSTIGATNVADVNAHSNIGTSASATQGAINTAIDTAISNLQSSTITSISLVPKSTDANGKIIFYTGDEPSP